MKYIMFEDVDGRKFPVIFPEHFVHEDTAKAVMRVSPTMCRPISAGFVALGIDIATHGESETLKMKSKETDAAYIVAGSAAAFMPEVMVTGLMDRIKARRPK